MCVLVCVCVKLLYVKFVCVKLWYVTCVEVEAGGGPARDTESKTRTPHKVVGKKTVRDGYSTDAAVGLALCIYI